MSSPETLGDLGVLAVHCQRIIEHIDSLRDEIVETSRRLHAHPELSGEEHESAKLLAGRAAGHGFTVEQGIAGLPTSFRALRVCSPAFKRQNQSRRLKAGLQTDHRLKAGLRTRVAFLAEYDALPVVGHGCGHNIIGTASTYAAIGLASVADDLPGEVALFGTPAEETDGGKITMLDAGVFDDVAAALMIHPGVYTEVAYSSLACASLVVEFFGKSAHAAASPWKGVNALDAMIQLFVSIDLLKKQLPTTARAPGVILHGGERANMVPDYTKAQFSLRGKDSAEVEMVMRRVVECARAAAQATGARMEHHVEGNRYDDMRPDAALADIFRHVWRELGGEEPATDPKPHGSLDIGNLSHRFPCLHPSIRITPDDTIGGHTHEFAAATVTPFAEEQLVRAIKALALTGLNVLNGTSGKAGP